MQTREFKGVATSIRTENGILIGRYRRTDVCTKNGNTIVLNTGGWSTYTTKARMNQFANEYCGGRFVAYQREFEWFVDVNGVTLPFTGNVIEFTI